MTVRPWIKEAKLRSRKIRAYTNNGQLHEATQQIQEFKASMKSYVTKSNDNNEVNDSEALSRMKFLRYTSLTYLRIAQISHELDYKKQEQFIKDAQKNLAKSVEILGDIANNTFVKKNSKLADVEILSAELLAAKGQNHNALAHYHKALELLKDQRNSRIDRAFYNLATCYMKCEDFESALNFFLLAIPPIKKNIDKQILKSANRSIGECLCKLRRHSEAIPYFEILLKLSQPALLDEVKSIETVISKTTNLIQYAQKFESLKSGAESIAEEKKIQYFKHMIDLAKELDYDVELWNIYLKMTKLYEFKPNKLHKLYFELEELVVKTKLFHRDKDALNTTLGICKSHIKTCSTDLDQAKVYLTIGRLNEILKNPPTSIRDAYVSARKAAKNANDDELLLQSYICLYRFYKKENHETGVQRYVQLIEECAQRTQNTRRIVPADHARPAQVPAICDAPIYNIDDVEEISDSNFDDFILGMSAISIGENPSNEIKEVPKDEEKEEEMKKFKKLKKKQEARNRRRRGAPTEEQEVVKDGVPFPVFQDDEDAWICNSDDDDEINGTLEETMKRFNDDEAKYRSKRTRIKSSKSDAKNKKRPKNEKPDEIIIASSDDSDVVMEGSPEEQTNYTVKLGTQKIRQIISDKDQTVGLLIRQLEDQHLKALTRLKISEMKVGKTPLRDDDLLIEVLNDGDVIIAVIGEKTSVTILSKYNDTPAPHDPKIKAALEKQGIPKNGETFQTSLVLPYLGISDRAGSALIRCIGDYFPLVSLDLCGNALGRESERALSVVLPSLPNLHTLSLASNCFSFQNPQLLLPHCDKLTSLSLSFNPISKTGFAALNEVLKKCANLECLYLEGVGLTEEKAQILAQGLRSCSSLTSLFLSHNHLVPKDRLLWSLEESVSTLTKLTTLHMRNIGLQSEHSTSLVRLLSPLSVKDLDLAHNKLGSEGASVLNKALQEEASNITNLNLAYNNTYDVAALPSTPAIP